MADPELASSKSVNGWRVAAIAATLALAFALLGNAWLRKTELRKDLPVEPRQAAAFEIGGAENRRALTMLQGGEPSEWLGRNCDPTMPDSFRVTHLRMFDHGMEIRTAQVIGGGAPRVKYSDDSPPDRNWTAAPIDTGILKRLQAPLESAGYPGAMQPSVESWKCGGEAAMVDSCMNGLYYGAVRECPDDKVFPLVARVLELAQAQVEKTKRNADAGEQP
jgi:hypothetical protein